VVSRTLEHYERIGTANIKATNVYWLTDSQNLATFLTKGSGKSHIQKEVFRAMTLCKKLNFRIIPIHLLREDPRIEFPDETFQKSNQKYNFTIDLFASNQNKKCPV
jgi:hypothetical protein